MPAGQYDITAEQGSTFALNMNYQDADDNPISLTGYTGGMQVRRYHSATGTLLNSNTSDVTFTIESTDAAVPTGNVQIDISAATMSTVPAGNHVYDIELHKNGTVTRLIEGRFIVTPEVTRG